MGKQSTICWTIEEPSWNLLWHWHQSLRRVSLAPWVCKYVSCGNEKTVLHHYMFHHEFPLGGILGTPSGKATDAVLKMVNGLCGPGQLDTLTSCRHTCKGEGQNLQVYRINVYRLAKSEMTELDQRIYSCELEVVVAGEGGHCVGRGPPSCMVCATAYPSLALVPMQSMGHRSSHTKSWDLISKVENCSGEVNFGWILTKLNKHVPKTVFYWRHNFWNHF